jgi:hypothetical protein
MKTKPIPAIITLIAGLITCLVAFYAQINQADFVRILFFVLVGFYILGVIIKVVLDKNLKEEETSAEDSGEAGMNEEQSADGDEENKNDGKDK